jgi:hypothetical protein
VISRTHEGRAERVGARPFGSVRGGRWR